MQPLIGITTGSRVDERGWRYSEIYIEIGRAVEQAGGLPLAIPNGISEDTLRGIYARLDGVLLPGGPDVNPMHFGETPHPQLGEVDDARDRIELPLARWAFADDVPLFGICRGHQVLNVALGGRLVQDMRAQLDGNLLGPHTEPSYQDRSALTHPVSVVPDSRLAAIIGSTSAQVNSLHHQSISAVAPGFVVTAQAPDAVIEAIEHPGKQFALSVQWHPEDLYTTDPAMSRLFAEFVTAARTRMMAAL